MSADTDWAEEKARINALGLKYQVLLGLEWLTIVHVFDEKVAEDTTLASTVANWEYRNAAITWNLPAVARVLTATLESTMVHEMVHVLLNPVESHLPDKPHVIACKEFAVESVARAIVCALRL